MSGDFYPLHEMNTPINRARVLLQDRLDEIDLELRKLGYCPSCETQSNPRLGGLEGFTWICPNPECPSR